MLFLRNGCPGMSLYVTDSGYYNPVLSSPINVFETYTLTGSWDGNTWKIYMNGDLMGSGPLVGTVGTSSKDTVFSIGSNPSGINGGSDYWSFDIFNARIYKTALTPEEVAENYRFNQLRFDF